MNIKNYFLKQGEYFQQKFKKDKIFIHHTAGGHRPDWTIDGWNADKNSSGKPRLVATAFVIGGLSTRSDKDSSWDGKILRTFNEEYWAVHLNGQEMYHLDKTSIAIEICNYGEVTRDANGNFISYVNHQIPKEQVVKLSKPFREFKYYHKYTNAQLDSLKELLKFLSESYEIDLKKGLREWIKKEELKMPHNLNLKQQQQWLRENGFVGKDGEKITADGIKGPNTEWALSCLRKSAFEFNTQCLNGSPGLWTHTNVRADKKDCFPQQELIDLILSL